MYGSHLLSAKAIQLHEAMFFVFFNLKAVLLTECTFYAHVNSDFVAHLSLGDTVQSAKWWILKDRLKKKT